MASCTNPPAVNAQWPPSTRDGSSCAWNGMNEGGRDRKAPKAKCRARRSLYWTDGNEERIFVITTGFYLVALDAKTGISRQSASGSTARSICEELNVGFDHVTSHRNSSPPMVYRDTVIVPPALEEGFTPDSMKNTPGYVMAFDARSGKPEMGVFTPLPKDGEFGAEIVGSRSQRLHRQHRRVGADLGRSRTWAPHIFPWKRRPTITMAVIA